MYDLHSHTYYSDGSYSPARLVAEAHRIGLELLGVTDHDTTSGLAEAAEQAKLLSLPLIRGVEIQADYAPAKLHILGLGIDPGAECISHMLGVQAERREVRNAAMLQKLAAAGMDVYRYYEKGRGCTTRTHVAAALVRAGFAESISDAFARLIGRNAPVSVSCKHPSMRETVECINEAGGVAVLAHPCKMRCDHRKLVEELADCGLWGIEAYYPGCDEDTIRFFSGLGREFGLQITCGSDCHGDFRPEAPLGCAWQSCEELDDTLEKLRRFAL